MFSSFRMTPKQARRNVPSRPQSPRPRRRAPLLTAEHNDNADDEHDQGYAEQDDFHKYADPRCASCHSASRPELAHTKGSTRETGTPLRARPRPGGFSTP
jgi:hypothetical protein